MSVSANFFAISRRVLSGCRGASAQDSIFKLGGLRVTISVYLNEDHRRD